MRQINPFYEVFIIVWAVTRPTKNFSSFNRLKNLTPKADEDFLKFLKNLKCKASLVVVSTLLQASERE
ncbi:hypothetical protein HOLleu_00126 [Holothuria leucospilota]|uniref:Uncharacterized protein n=1 Tax=Holothuria leucospilota TaxID=206669 RepID=A0A9Q1CLU7_HOLLE|nr:hypothetical protein HOLleu_00126 [Holothuria leucospilota]